MGGCRAGDHAVQVQDDGGKPLRHQGRSRVGRGGAGIGGMNVQGRCLAWRARVCRGGDTPPSADGGIARSSGGRVPWYRQGAAGRRGSGRRAAAASLAAPCRGGIDLGQSRMGRWNGPGPGEARGDRSVDAAAQLGALGLAAVPGFPQGVCRGSRRDAGRHGYDGGRSQNQRPGGTGRRATGRPLAGMAGTTAEDQEEERDRQPSRGRAHPAARRSNRGGDDTRAAPARRGA